MLARTYSFTPVGIDAHLVEVEVDLRSTGQEAYTLIVVFLLYLYGRNLLFPDDVPA